MFQIIYIDEMVKSCSAVIHTPFMSNSVLQNILYNDYTRNNQTKAYLQALESDMGIPVSQLIR